MDYTDLIARAFRVTLRHRFLWLLGILAGGAGGFSFNFRLPYSDSSGRAGADQLPEMFSRAFAWCLAHLPLLIVLGAVILLLALFFFVISVMAKGGLISSAAELDRRRPEDFWTAIHTGYHAFWRLLALALLIVAAVIAALTAAALPVIVLIITKHYWAAVGVGILLLPPFIALAIYLGLLLIYAERFAVIDANGVTASLAHAHQLLLTCKKEVLLVWLLAILFGIVSSFGITLAIILIALPHVVAGVVVYLNYGLMPTVVYAAFPTLLLFAATVLLSGISAAFRSAFWTLAYLELAHPTPQPSPLPA